MRSRARAGRSAAAVVFLAAACAADPGQSPPFVMNMGNPAAAPGTEPGVAVPAAEAAASEAAGAAVVADALAAGAAVAAAAPLAAAPAAATPVAAAAAAAPAADPAADPAAGAATDPAPKTTATAATVLKHYRNVEALNTTSCLETIAALPLSTYEFEHDTTPGARHLGVVGAELEQLVPSAVSRATRSFVAPERGAPPVVVEDVALVDKSVLFMLNVAASQALNDKVRGVERDMAALAEAAGAQTEVLDDLGERLARDAGEAERAAVAAAAADAAAAAAEGAREAARQAGDVAADGLQREREEALLVRQEALAAERMVQEDARERQRAADDVRLHEETAAKREAARAATERDLAALRLENDREIERLRRDAELERVAAEAAAKAAADRENEDLSLRKIAAKGEATRQRVLEAIDAVLTRLGAAAASLLADKRRLAALVGAVVAVLGGAFFAREGAVLLRQVVESRLGRPKLVRETSRARFGGLAGRSSTKVPMAEVVKHFDGVILPSSLTERVHQLAVSTRNARRNRVPFRHLLLHGPPGTGKTMVARRLAEASGMDYALMSGGDVGPLGKDAVTQLHALFAWANKSSSGLLLFIDEAEAFLGSRSRAGMSEEMRNALNALLYQTGTASNKFMMVLATNRAADLDEAVLDRTDEALFFGTPSQPERTKLLALYFDLFVKDRSALVAEARAAAKGKAGRALGAARAWARGDPAPIDVGKDVLDDAELRALTAVTDGFSGREISKLMVAIQSAAYGRGGSLDKAALRVVVEQKVEEHRRKTVFANGEDL